MDRFVKLGADRIKDTQTGQEWLVGPDQDTSWTQARAWISKVCTSGGKWRLPDIEDLEKLYEEEAGPAKLDKVFPLSSHFVWSGRENDTNTAYAFFFPLGADNWCSRFSAKNFRAMAVRAK